MREDGNLGRRRGGASLKHECLPPDGKMCSIEEHIGRGSNKDPGYTVRIAFTWWEDGQKVLVGSVGLHQRTAGT